MSAYVKARDRHKPRMASEGKRVACGHCGERTFAPYWWNWRGQVRMKPLCRECHERNIASQVREDWNE